MRKKKEIHALALVPAEEQVKKHVGAIHTSGEASLVGRKLVNTLLLNAYDSLLTRRTHKIPIRHLCASIGWDESKNLERLQEALRKLASTPVEFNMMEDGKETWRTMSMISFGEIKDGVCTYRYDEYLAERLYDPEIYALINIAMQRKFEGGYALALYENCVRYKAVGSTGYWDLNKFRKIVGATAPMYDEFKYLKRDVIAKPVAEVNRVSDIHLEPDYKTSGRRVTAIRFLITENPQQTLLQPEILDEHAALRETETFKRLREHGIGERLALDWIIRDEPRVRDIVKYVEEKDRKKQIKGTTAGYIRTLIEDPEADVKNTKQAHEKAREEKSLEIDKMMDRIRMIDSKISDLESGWKVFASKRTLEIIDATKTSEEIAQLEKEFRAFISVESDVLRPTAKGSALRNALTKHLLAKFAVDRGVCDVPTLEDYKQSIDYEGLVKEKKSLTEKLAALQSK